MATTGSNVQKARPGGTRKRYRTDLDRIANHLGAFDRLRQLVPHPLELTRVRVQLGAACAALSQKVAHEHEAARLKEELVDRVVEDRCPVDALHDCHAASTSVSVAARSMTSFSGCRTRIVAVRIAPPTESTASVANATR